MPGKICKCISFNEIPSLKSDELSESINELLEKEYLKRIYNTIGDTVVVDVRNLEWSFNLPAEGESKDYKYRLRKADHLRNLYITKKQTVSTNYPLKSDELDSLNSEKPIFQNDKFEYITAEYHKAKDLLKFGWVEVRRFNQMGITYIVLKKPIKTETDELDGIVVSEELAKISPCTRIKDTNLVFTKGVVGALSKEQRDKYCPSITEVEREEFRKRTVRWSRAVKTCKERTKHLTGADRVKSYIECMSEEARKEKTEERISYI